MEGVTRNFNAVALQYRKHVCEEVKHLQFIGMPTGSYEKQNLMVKPELAKVYIPLDFSGEKYGSETVSLKELLKESSRVVVLGDPGTGKSTLAKYLALIHSRETRKDDGFKVEERIPFIIPIREFVSREKTGSQAFNFVDYLKLTAEDNYSFNKMDKDFFIGMLEMGKAIVLFDGLDEVASESGRSKAAKKIRHFSVKYPDTPIWVTSRIVGYTVDVKLDEKLFNHHYLAPVSPEQADAFIKKWYEIQVPNDKTLRTRQVDLLQNAVKKN
ncbi:MAG: NACHT domain-containing protein, partial [bacterium]|nr:NACHT domain-containing protein [bacterium]